MKRFIQVTRENREFLCKAFRCTSRLVDYALTFDSERGNSEKAKKIRSLALQRGGVVMVTLPEKDVVWPVGNK